MAPSAATITLPQRSPRVEAVPTAPARIQLAPVQKFQRVHLAAQQRPAAMAELHDAALRFVVTAGGPLKTSLSLDARLSPATLQPTAHLAMRALFIVLDFGGECLGLVELDLLAAGALLHALGRSTDVMGPPRRLTAVEEAGLGWVVLTALADARADSTMAPFAPRLITITMDRAEALRFVDGKRRHAVVLAHLTVSGLKTNARLLLPALWLQSKLEQLPEEAPAALHPAVASARLPVRVMLGSSMLASGEQSRLRAGDLLFLTGVKREPEGLTGTARVIGPTFELRGEFIESGFVPSHVVPLPTQEYAMSSPVDPTLPVEVEIELARLRLPLHQLGAIKPGAVMPLHINAAQQVVVRIGDKAVARAELVEVEGEVGARIVAML